jgi:hypothetical protein
LGCDNIIAEIHSAVNWQIIKNGYYFGGKTLKSFRKNRETGSNDHFLCKKKEKTPVSHRKTIK